jgi:hypothetical protein
LIAVTLPRFASSGVALHTDFPKMETLVSAEQEARCAQIFDARVDTGSKKLQHEGLSRSVFGTGSSGYFDIAIDVGGVPVGIVWDLFVSAPVLESMVNVEMLLAP